MANQKEATLLLKIKEVGSAALDKVVISLGDIRAMALKLVEALMKPIEAYREQELAVNRLTQSMVNSGVFTSDLRNKYNEMSDALSKVTLYQNDQITSAMAVLQTQARGITLTKEITQATLDFASAKGIDLVSAAEMVGKTLGGETNALARQGIAIDMTKSGTERLAQVTEALSDRFRDQATVATQGLGVMDQIKNQFQEQQEIVGGELAPTMIVLLKTFQDVWFSVDNGASKAQMLGDVFSWLVKTALYVKAAFDELGAAIGIGMAAAVESIKAAVTLQFSKALQIWKDADKALADDQVARATELSNRLDAIDQRKYEQKNIDRENDAANEQRSLENLNRIKVDDQARKMADDMAYNDYILSLQMASYDQQLQAQISYLDKKIQNEQNASMKIAMIKQRSDAQMQLQNIAYQKQKETFDNMMLQNQVNAFSGAMNLMSAVAADGSAVQFYAMKAAAMAQAIVAANLASAQALAAPPGPPTTIPLSNWAFTAGMLNVAAIAATAIKGAGKFAEGGIVKARPGGMLGIIGEAGRDEAVIPLEDGKIPGSGGGNITIIVNGGMLGDQASAHEFAVEVDKQLYRLRKSNESLAFDSGVV